MVVFRHGSHAQARANNWRKFTAELTRGASGGAVGWTSRGKEFASCVLGPGLCFRVKLVLGDKANPQTTFHLNEGHVTDVRSAGTCSPSAMSTMKSRCLAPSQRRGRLGRARRHTADAVRHWATSLVSATPSTKPCSRFLGAKSAATSHRARSLSLIHISEPTRPY